LWMVLAGAAQARGAEPVARIPLGPMGYQTMVPEFLLAGSSMLRVDFVDAEHLLVTFGLRQLMERLPGDPVDDDDRTVGAAVVELPTGKALARTEWRLHDRGQYLWELGHGRFLLRVRDRLSVIAPMAAGGAKGRVPRDAAAAYRAAHRGIDGVCERGPVDGGDDEAHAGEAGKPAWKRGHRGTW